MNFFGPAKAQEGPILAVDPVCSRAVEKAALSPKRNSHNSSYLAGNSTPALTQSRTHRARCSDAPP